MIHPTLFMQLMHNSSQARPLVWQRNGEATKSELSSGVGALVPVHTQTCQFGLRGGLSIFSCREICINSPQKRSISFSNHVTMLEKQNGHFVIPTIPNEKVQAGCRLALCSLTRPTQSRLTINNRCHICQVQRVHHNQPTSQS